jgi:WD40 repeat protein
LSIDKVVALAAPEGSGIGFGSAWSPNGDRIAVAGHAHSVLIWDIASGSVIVQSQHAGTVPCVAWSPDGRTIASGTSAGTIHLIDAASGRQVHAAPGHSDELRSVAFAEQYRQN